VSARLVSVAVPVPALDVLTYRVPPTMDMPAAGARVVVPLGHRSLTGVALGPAEPPAAEIELRDVQQLLDTDAFLPVDVVTLMRWVAEYYIAGPGAALAGAMPPHALTERVHAFKTITRFVASAEGLALSARAAVTSTCTNDQDVKLSGRQLEVLGMLSAVPGGLTSAELADRGVSSAVISRLRGRELVDARQARVDRDPFASAARSVQGPADQVRVLTDEQTAAVERLHHLADARAFHVALLHGVTGSGKTEVYLRLAQRVQQAGRGVLMLVPEIALTPAMSTLFRARFGDRVAIQHSGLSTGERHDQWHRIRAGDVDLVVGTRSAVFAPLAQPGLIIVDEEHDTSYKQDETPRYHGRDVAVMRGQLAGALVVLGSATPSMESYRNATLGRYSLVTLERRVHDRPLATVRVVNMREEYAAGGPDVVFGEALRAAIADRLERREQSLILLNRRGWAVAVFCRQCSDALECPNCSVSLTVHRAHKGWRARCHYCNFSQAVPLQCPTCAAPYMEQVGFGTERVEEELAKLFPQARIGRIDRDTIRRRGSLADLLGRFADGALDILVGTQMIAKGHDFPRVTLVGVVSADVGLGLADFRAGERTFQLLTQVAGRAGRGELVGEAIIQTLYPTHYSIQLACTQDYKAFFDREIEFRQAMKYPPTLSMINIVVRGRTYDDAMHGAANLAGRAQRVHKGAFQLLGPAPAPLTRIKGEHRAQFFMKGVSRARMREALTAALASMPEIARRVTVDVDPLSVL
jgi:primosomal protein N' (replication factor Y) (superfamily II helicase)